MKDYIKKHEFLIGSIVIYCIPFILSFLVYQFFLLIENNNRLQNIDCIALYTHPSSLLGYLDLIVGLFSIIGSAFLARSAWNSSWHILLNWTTVIIVFIALFGFSTFVPWFNTNASLHKKRVLIFATNEISKAETKEIAILIKHKELEINMAGENRDFNIYNVVNNSNDSILRKIRLPINYIKIQNIEYFGNNVQDIHGKIVISNAQRSSFFLKDTDNKILGLDLEIIKND